MPDVPDRRRRHLLDPDNPRPEKRDMSVTKVQQWVLSVLAATTIWHLALGIVIGALSLPDDDRTGTVALLVIAGCFGVLAMVVALVIHRRSPLHPLLLLGLLPALVGVWWEFLR